MTSTLLLMNGALFGITAIVFVVFVGRAKRKEDPKAQAAMEAKMVKRHNYYQKFGLTKNLYASYLKAFSVYGITSEKDLAMQAVSAFDMSIIVMVVLVVFGLVVLQNVIYTLLLGFFGYIYMQRSLVKKADKIVSQVYKELSSTVSLFRQAYLSTNSVEKAFIVTEVPTRLKPIFEEMRQIITNQSEEQLRGLIDNYPITVVGTLATTLYLNAKNGAQPLPNGGDSLDSTLLVIEQECDSEYRNCIRSKQAFSTMDIMALAGLVVWPAAEMFMKSQIPGIVVLIEGIYGEAIHMLICVLTIFAYSFVSNAARLSVASSTDVNSLIVALSTMPFINNIATNLMPKSYMKKQKVRKKLSSASSGKSMQYLYTEKLLYFIGGFVIGLLALFWASFTVRTNFKNNYNSLSLIPATLTVTQQSQVKRFDDEFIQIPWDTYVELYQTDDELLGSLISKSVRGLGSMELTEQVSRVRTKYETYHNSTAKPWFPVLALVIGIAAWFMPDYALSKRKKDIIAETGNEVASLQALMIVLSYSHVSCDEALRLLEMQSKVLRIPLRNALTIYKRNPDQAMDYLVECTDNEAFRHIVHKLRSCIYDISISSAFADMSAQRQQTATIAELARQDSLEKKKNSAKLISILPAGAALLGCFVAPVLILGLQQMSAVTSGLG